MTELQSNRQDLFQHIRETASIAWPVIMGQLGHMVIGTADTIMIGGMGSRELSAASIANGIFFLVAVVGIGVAVVISPLTAQVLGAGKGREALSLRLHQGLIVAIFISIVSILLLFGGIAAIPHLRQQPETVPLAQSYLMILTASLPSMMIYLAFKHFLDGFESTRPGMVVMAVMVLANVGLNWLLIHGHWGMPKLGLDGAGYATLISRVLGMFLIGFYVAFSKPFGQYFQMSQLFKPNWKEIKEILGIGLPSGFQYFFEVGSFSGAVLLAGYISKEAQSAHQIAIQIASVTYMFYMGIASAVSIRVGNALGRRDFPAIKLATKAAIICGLACVVVFVSLMVGLHKVLPQLYIQEPDVILMASAMLFIAAVFQFFDGMQAIIMGVLRGISDVNVPLGITFIAYWLIGLPCAWVFSLVLDWGTQGIWYGLTLGLAFSALMLALRMRRQLRKDRLEWAAENME
jgi:MATE family multidrug resistance protein